MTEKPYYLAYESRYQKVFAAGIKRWGHSPDDKVMLETLTEWVEKNQLKGKKVIEFACGEGACAEILSKLGCIYKGVDIAPSAIDKAKANIAAFPDASVSLLDMVNERIDGTFDAALDCMGFHMLVLDSDRMKYLHNAFSCLNDGAPMLFYKESYRTNAPDMAVTSLEEWKKITGDDYDTPQLRTAPHTGTDIEVNIPLVPGRARNKEGYFREMSEAGFIVDNFIEMEINEQNPYSASIYVHKPDRIK
jgi:hypothetical protein